MSAALVPATRIPQIILEQLGAGIRGDDPPARGELLVGDLGADSLDLVELAMAIEEDFGIEIPDDLDLSEAWPTVGHVIAYVEKATAGK